MPRNSRLPESQLEGVLVVRGLRVQVDVFAGGGPGEVGVR
jgi:hypothetical protein